MDKRQINWREIDRNLEVTIYTKSNKVMFEITGFRDKEEAEAYAFIQHKTLGYDNYPDTRGVTIH